MWQLITVCIAFALFVAYNIAILVQFGIPKNLSESFYLYDNKKKHFGYIFTLFMFTMAFCLMPGWIEISEVWSSWSHYLTFLAFLTAAAICFVGAAPAFRANKLEGTVHEVSAKICAATALVWCFVVCWNIAYVPAIGAAIPAIVGACTKTWKTAQIYWLEMMAFGATFATVITAAAILL
jgi:hypothetical protein